jgi:hypothetical protein
VVAVDVCEVVAAVVCEVVAAVVCEVVTVDGCRLFVGPTSICQITLNCFLFRGLRYFKS